MSFRLIPKSVTGRYLAFFRRNSVALGPITSKWLKIDLYRLRRKCSPKNLVFSHVSLMAIFAEVTENEHIIV